MIKVERVGGHGVIYRCEQVKSKKREIDEGRGTRERRVGATGIKNREQRDRCKETAIDEREPERKDYKGEEKRSGGHNTVMRLDHYIFIYHILCIHILIYTQ